MSRKTKKLMWSAPLVAALAVVGALAAFIALAPHAAQAQDAMMVYGPPTNVMVEADGQRVLEVTWDAPATGTATAYRVDISEDGMIWQAEQATLTDTIYDDGSLMPGTTRYYRVFAIFGDKGAGAPSATVMGTTDPGMAPGKPTALTLANGSGNDATQVALTWVAPSSNGGFPITGYKIERSKDNSAWTTVKADTGLTDEITADCGLTGAAVTECSHTDGTTSSVGSLPYETKFYYRVSAINKIGTGMPTDSESHTTGGAASVSAPAAPLGLTAQGSNSQVTLLWLQPASGDPAGNPITGYNIERSKDSDDLATYDWKKVYETGVRTSQVVGGAFSEGEVAWHYRVEAKTRKEPGLETDALIVGPPDPSTHGAVASLRARPKVPLSIELSWRAGTGVVDGTTFRIDYSEDNRVWKQLAAGATITADEDTTRYSHTDSGLKAGQMRYYRVIPITSTVLHQVSAVVSAVPGAPSTPGKPTALASTATADKITLTWIEPVDDADTDDVDESVVTGYRIERSMSATGPWTTLKDVKFTTDTTAGTDVPHIVDGCASGTECAWADKDLMAATTWHYRVRGMNAGVVGPPSEAHSQKTSAGAAPGQPVDLVAVQRGTSRVDLYWNAPGDPDGDPVVPADMAGAPVTGYKVEVSTDDGDTWTTVIADTMSRATMYSHTGLTALADDAKRTYRVSAISSVGHSVPSLTDVAMAGNILNVAPMAGAAIADQTVKVGSMVMVQSTITDADTGDTLTWTVASSDEMKATATVSNMGMVTITGVAAGTATITVTATDRGGETATQDIMVTVVIGAPDKPTMVSAMANSDTQITVSWAAPASDGGSAITGYIIERRYDGDMMGDIPSDGYNDGVNGRSFAFTNHMNWWETLNCKGMLRVAGSDADPSGDSDDKMMYCQHYANTAPTNIGSGTIMADSELDMKIKALFEKRYVIISDAATMMHADMNLMAATEYTYRVSAVNAIGRSGWSDAAMATTEASQELMAPTNLRANPVGSRSVLVDWDHAGGATGFIIIAVNIADPSQVMSEAVNLPTARGGAIANLATGEDYNIYVAAFRGTEEFVIDLTQKRRVTIE